MKTLVTGGAGCIGSEVVDKLLKRGKVIVVDNLSSGKIEHIEKFLDNKDFRLVEADITSDDLTGHLDGVDMVFHLAANPDIKFSAGDRTDKDLNQNTIATYNVLDAMQKTGVKKIAFSSSSVVYGKADRIPTPENYGPLKPTSLYGASKLACEALVSAYCNMFGMQGWIFRFANIVGDKSRKKGRTVVSDFIFKLRNDPTHLEILGDGRQSKSYLLVDECVDGMIFAVDHSNDPVNIFNLGTKDAITVDEIAKIVINEMGLKNVKISHTGSSGGWPGDITNFLLDVTKLEKLGWSSRHNSAESVRTSAKRMLG